MQLNANNFLKNLNSITAPKTNVKILVGASGGVDSMVLCDLLFANKINFEIAHVNYGLRGEESNLDQLIVEEFAKKNQITFHLLKITDQEKESIPKNGIQKWARDLRYNWFEKIRIENQCDFIAVAHHGNDQAETILHQFIRGGTFAALRGMKSQRDQIIRPLLSFTKAEILEYANANKIAWREDASNNKNIYTRNKVRNELIPLAQEINPAIVDSLMERAILFSEAEQLIHFTLQKEISKNVVDDNSKQTFNTNWIILHPYKHLLLWEILQPYNFSPEQIEEAFLLRNSHSGAAIYSSTHILLHDRDQFIIAEQSKSEDISITIDQFEFQINQPIILSGKITPGEDVRFSSDLSIAFLDADKLKLPLKVRKWREGDKFKPLGMTGHQKVSDFLIQQKMSVLDKQNVLVLLSDDKILWICGMRISEDHKINEHSKHALRLNFSNSL